MQSKISTWEPPARRWWRITVRRSAARLARDILAARRSGNGRRARRLRAA